MYAGLFVSATISEWHQNIIKHFQTCGSLLDIARNNLVSKDIASIQVSLWSSVDLAILRIKLRVNPDVVPR